MPAVSPGSQESVMQEMRSNEFISTSGNISFVKVVINGAVNFYADWLGLICLLHPPPCVLSQPVLGVTAWRNV